MAEWRRQRPGRECYYYIIIQTILINPSKQILLLWLSASFQTPLDRNNLSTSIRPLTTANKKRYYPNSFPPSIFIIQLSKNSTTLTYPFVTARVSNVCTQQLAKRRPAQAILRIGLGILGEKKLDDGFMAVLGGIAKRRRLVQLVRLLGLGIAAALLRQRQQEAEWPPWLSRPLP